MVKKAKTESRAQEPPRHDSKTLETVKGLLDQAEKQIRSARHLLFEDLYRDQASQLPTVEASGDATIVEGIFDGEQMVAQDGKKYAVSVNYASKSKLVAGDVLKLTIAKDGTFVYKQIGPIDRQHLIGTLEEAGGNYFVKVGAKNYNVLLASVTYYKVKIGERVTIIVPKSEESDWAALENVLGS